jgi:hypothetical protein
MPKLACFLLLIVKESFEWLILQFSDLSFILIAVSTLLSAPKEILPKMYNAAKFVVQNQDVLVPQESDNSHIPNGNLE